MSDPSPVAADAPPPGHGTPPNSTPTADGAAPPADPVRTPLPDPARIRTSDDLEVSGYLEAARERSGDRAAQPPPLREPRESIVIIDFGGQTAMLIARRVRELNVYCELLPHTASWDQVRALNPKGFILSGGPASVRDKGAPAAAGLHLRERPAGAGHLLRHAGDRRGPGRPRGGRERTGVRPRRDPSRARGPGIAAGAARGDAGLDEPR